MKNNGLHNDIDRWFNGEMSVAEERLLTRRLLNFKGEDDTVDEALAVMGYTVVRRKGKQNRRILMAAATVAVLVVFGIVTFFSTPSVSQSECYAYIGGQRIDNSMVVLSLMEGQLNEMSLASDDVSRQLQDDLDDFKVIFDN